MNINQTEQRKAIEKEYLRGVELLLYSGCNNTFIPPIYKNNLTKGDVSTTLAFMLKPRANYSIKDI